jgi:alkyl hydroperoxide reductase subunit AhpC
MASSRQLGVGDEAPDFSAQTSEGAIRFHEWLGESWGYVDGRASRGLSLLARDAPRSFLPYLPRRMLFTHSDNFSPISRTVRASGSFASRFLLLTSRCQELGSPSRCAAEFAERNVKVIGLSCDAVASHQCLPEDSDEVIARGSFSIIRDPERAVARLYGMLGSRDDASKGQTIAQCGIVFLTNTRSDKRQPLTVRSVFVVDPSRTIRLIQMVSACCSLNFDEIVRIVDALQLADVTGALVVVLFVHFSLTFHSQVELWRHRRRLGRSLGMRL